MALSAKTRLRFSLTLYNADPTFLRTRYAQVSGGRFHTDIGYYNTAFHHGTWFSTATSRPFMYYFEDSGGPLPVHEVGVTTTGYIPSGKFNLHWTAEVGNGSAEFGTASFGDGVENFTSDRNRKDTNFAILSKPEWIEGLQVGASFLQGSLIPNEHFNSPMGYTQLSYHIGKFRPHFRFQVVNIPDSDPPLPLKAGMSDRRRV